MGVGGQKNGDKKRRKGECCIDNLLPFLNDVVESSIWACWEGKKNEKGKGLAYSSLDVISLLRSAQTPGRRRCVNPRRVFSGVVRSDGLPLAACSPRHWRCLLEAPLAPRRSHQSVSAL